MSEASTRAERIKVIAARFLARSVADAVAMKGLIHRARTGDTVAFESVGQLSHRMAGTAGTLGFEAVGVSAGSIERLAERMVREGPESAQDICRELTCLVDELEKDVRVLLNERGDS